MITDKISENILLSLQQTFQMQPKSSEIEVAQTSSREHGDYTSNIAFRLAKDLKKSPMSIAEELAVSLQKNGGFQKVEAVNGFLNFFLDHEYFQGILAEVLKKKEHYADLDLYKGKKIQVEFISSNPTGPPTLANGRGGYGGDVLSNVFAKVGATVEREFYVNDYGNQVRILGNSVLIAAGLKKAEADEDFYRGDYIDNWVEGNRDFIEKNQNDMFAVGYKCAQYVLNDYIKPAVAKMKIEFDKYYSEKNLYDKDLVAGALKFLDDRKMTYEAEGAKWLRTSDFGDDKDRVLVKSNGDYTYMVPDVGYHWEKFADRKYDMVVDILGADHFGYTARMLAAISALGYGSQLKYLLTQMVRLVKDGQEFKMSKRKGVVVTMDDLFELIGGTVSDASDVARFFFLMRSFNTHMDFDLDLAKERSDKNPVFYVKYAYARLSSILRNADGLKLPKADLALLTEPQETELIEQMAQLPQVLASIVMFDEYPVHYLTFYAIDLAKKFHVFYDKCKVINEEDLALSAARIALIQGAQIALGIVMRDLIGIDAPERM